MKRSALSQELNQPILNRSSKASGLPLALAIRYTDTTQKAHQNVPTPKS